MTSSFMGVVVVGGVRGNPSVPSSNFPGTEKTRSNVSNMNSLLFYLLYST